jgi:hypothetical protein
MSLDSSILRSYLLGRLEEDVRERVERQLFSDDGIFWERLCIEEDELVDEYAAGSLDDETRRAFERHFLCTAERRGKLAFVRALRAHLERQTHRENDLSSWLRRPVLVPAWSLAAAAALLALIPAGMFSLSGRDAREDTVTASVRPGLVRSAGGAVDRVRLTSGCRLLQLRLDPGRSEYPEYQATLYEVEGQELWSQSRLTTAKTDGRATATMTVPCELVPEGDYYVRLHGLPAASGGAMTSRPAPVLLQRYDFRILRD